MDSKEKLMQELNNLANLPEDWDGFGASSINKQTIDNTKDILDLILDDGIPVPTISPNPNGTISLDWEFRDNSVWVEIGITKYSFYTIPPMITHSTESGFMERDGYTITDIDQKLKELVHKALYVYGMYGR